MVMNGSVAPRPMVNSNDDASSAIVDRLVVGFIFLPEKCGWLIFCYRFQKYHAISGLYSQGLVGKCDFSLPEIMIYSWGEFFVTLIVFT